MKKEFLSKNTGVAMAVAGTMLAANLVPSIAAASLTAALTSDVGVSVGSGSSANSGQTNSSASANVNVGTNAKASSSNSGSGSMDADGEMHTMDTQQDTSASANAGLTALIISRSDVKDDAGGQAMTSSSVSSDSDLGLYVRSLVRSDENIQSVSAASDEVSVKYREPAKFLGIFSSSLSSEAKITADGKVKISRPWYGFLYSKSDDATFMSDSDLAATAQSASGSSSSSAGFSASAKARTISALHSALMKHYGASASANADVSADQSAGQ